MVVHVLEDLLRRDEQVGHLPHGRLKVHLWKLEQSGTKFPVSASKRALYRATIHPCNRLLQGSESFMESTDVPFEESRHAKGLLPPSSARNAAKGRRPGMVARCRDVRVHVSKLGVLSFVLSACAHAVVFRWRSLVSEEGTKEEAEVQEDAQRC